jgi:hypothetical protein
MRFALRFLALTLLLFAFAVPDAWAKSRRRTIHIDTPLDFCAVPPKDLDFTPVPSASRNLTTMDEEWGCRCAYYYDVCSPMVRCYTDVECRMNYACPPPGVEGPCTEETVCENVMKCDYEWYCWRECGRVDCYI